jgi:hypothetical protein
LSFAFEPRNKHVPKAAPLITSADCQRAQQGTRTEALHTDDSED